MQSQNRRVTNHPVLGDLPEAEDISFTVDGKRVTGRKGDVIASAIMASGQLRLRNTERSGSPRGIYCAIGHCFECRVTVDGVPGVRACLQPVFEGMTVTTAPGGGQAS